MTPTTPLKYYGMGQPQANWYGFTASTRCALPGPLK
jgi:hypothetical protein